MSGLISNVLHWYHYRRAVAIVLGLVFGLAMFWLYLNPGVLALHPEDRLFTVSDPSPQVVIVGIDDPSIQRIGHFPFERENYATVLDNLAAAGASAVVFDVGFTEAYTGDDVFRKAIQNDHVPVILAYGSSSDLYAPGHLVMNPKAEDELPLRTLRCADVNPDEGAPCRQPLAELASSVITTQDDGYVRTMPMFIQPQCYARGSCSTQFLTPLSFAAYRASLKAEDIPLSEGGGSASFGEAWTKPLPVDQYGQALINFTGPPGNFAAHGQYFSFKDVFDNIVPREKLAGKIVLVGAYHATGLHDEQFVPTGGGDAMPGVEIHANFLSMLLTNPPPFLSSEPALAVLLTVVLLGVLMGLLLAHMSIVKGLLTTLGVLAAYTLAMVVVNQSLLVVPDLLHPWLTIGLTLVGITAYRVLYEDREKRKVTSLFGQYLSPEIVTSLAAGRQAEVLLQGSRRELSLLFCDIRGFTSTSESMEAEAVAQVVEEYLTDLSDIIGKWRGTLDKYVGDEIVAFWNAPTDQPDHALLSVRCAFEMLAHGPDLQAKLAARGLPAIRFGIGVNTGNCVVGNLGSRKADWFGGRAQYTALGDTVNTAARFCGAAGAFELLLGQLTFEAVKDYVAVELVPGLQLKGKSAETFRVYRAMAIRQEPGAPWVPFPAALATQQTYAYTEQTMLGAGSTIAAESGEGGGQAPS